MNTEIASDQKELMDENVEINSTIPPLFSAFTY